MSRKPRRSHVSHERWLVSFADFMTLLFALFVVMFASSQQDHRKMQVVESSIRAAFQNMGIFAAPTSTPSVNSVVAPTARSSPIVVGDIDVAALAAAMVDLSQLKKRMEVTLAPQIANGTVSISLSQAGLLISLRDAAFFESGSSTPLASSIPSLDAIGHAIATTYYDVRIEGHTDDVPIHTIQFASNWELSTARATVLTQLLIEKDQVSANRLSAAGYAQYHPVASNLTAEGRSRNRRVDIIVLPSHQQFVTAGSVSIPRQGEAISAAKPADQQKLQEFLKRASTLAKMEQATRSTGFPRTP